MTIEIPFPYLCLIAFKVNLQFENKRIIHQKKLFKYIDTLITETLNNYNNSTDEYPNENWPNNINFKRLDYSEELLTMLKEFEGIITTDGDNLELNQDITLDDLEEMITEFNITSRFEYISTHPECLKVLGAISMKKIITKYQEQEELFYNEYMQLMNNPYDDTIRYKIIISLLKRMTFITAVNTLDKNTVMALYTWAENIAIDDLEDEYSKFPINCDFYQKSPFYDKDWNIEDLINGGDNNQFALFNHQSLSLEAVINMLWEIYCVKEDEEFVDIISDLEEEIETENTEEYLEDLENEENEEEIIPHDYSDTTCFYLKYIDKINQFFKDYGYNQELDSVKYRLLYLLDKPDWCLYDEFNFETILSELITYDLEEYIPEDEQIYKEFKNEAYYFITEVFNNHNEDDEVTIVKKLLFISTYYELTSDKTIEDILNTYINSQYYDLFSQIILGIEQGYTKKLTDI